MLPGQAAPGLLIQEYSSTYRVVQYNGTAHPLVALGDPPSLSSTILPASTPEVYICLRGRWHLHELLTETTTWQSVDYSCGAGNRVATSSGYRVVGGSEGLFAFTP